MNPILVSKRNEFALKQKALEAIFKDAGETHDLMKATQLKGADLSARALEVKAMNDELDALDTEIKGLVELEGTAARNAERIKTVAMFPQGAPKQNADGSDKRFKNFGDFVQKAIYNGGAELKAMGIDVGESGGFAVPDEVSQSILMVDPQDAILRSRSMVLPSGQFPDGKLEIPALRQGGSGILAGVTFSPVNEGTQGAANDPKLDLVILEPQRTSGYVLVGNSLLRNAPAMSAFIEKLFRTAKMALEDLKFMMGSGMNEPLGLLNAPCKMNVIRNTAATIKFADILQMVSLQVGGKGFWVANQKTIPAIVGLADLNNNAIFVQGDATKGISPTLLGYPIYFTFRQPTLGSEGDLMFVDANYYLIKDGSGPYIQASDQVKFLEDQTAIKMTWFYDGQPWVKNPILMDNGVDYASPMIVLK